MSTETAAAQSLRDLINRIQDTHHVFLRTELPFLEERIAKMASKHGQERPELFEVQQKLQDLRDDLTVHLEKEERILFPYIAELEASRDSVGPEPSGCFPSVRFPIRMMLMEHDNATEVLAELRSLTANYAVPEGLCECGREFYQRLAGLESDLKQHIEVENNSLFPRAIALEEM
jgi:regulator of cell morphogenesis and NO signaling